MPAPSPLLAALLVLATGLQAAHAASAEDMIADLTAGQCFSEVVGTRLPPGFTDPHKVGKPGGIATAGRSIPILQIASTTGPVGYYRQGPYCNVVGWDIDHARATARIEDAFKRLALAFDKGPVNHHPGPREANVRGVFVLMFRVPADKPIPVVMLQYDDRKSKGQYGAGVILGQ